MLVGAGCSFDTQVPAGRVITCSSNQDCPVGYGCRPAVDRCVELAQLNQPAPALSSASIAPTVGNLQTEFTLSFEVSAALAQVPTAYATSFGGSVQTYPFTCTPCAPGTSCSCSLFARADVPAPAEGPLHVWVELVDTVGNTPPPFEVGSLSIDLTPPGLANPAQLTLLPPPGATTPITELGLAGSAEVCFTVTEPLAAAPPPVWAAAPDDGGAFGFALESGFPLGLRYCYAGELEAGAVDGPKTIRAALMDLAGNPATVVLIDGDGGLVVDTTPPPAPDTSVDAGLLYRRAPWGELPSLAEPSFTLSSVGLAIGKECTLVVSEDAAGLRPIAQGAVEAGVLTPPLVLPGPDRAQVYVDLVDGAGNHVPGGPVLVRNEEWVATLGGKVAGDTLVNPHDCFARPVFEPYLVQADDAAAALSAPGAVDAGWVSIPGAGTWRMRVASAADSPDGFPTNNLAPALATYDSAHGQVVLVVSQGDLNSPLETWVYDGDWHQRFALGAQPPYREGGSLSFDSVRGRAVLFGGDNTIPSAPQDLCDTWEWDGTLWRNTVACQSTSDGGASALAVPSPRAQAAQAYDRVRQRTVLFGGETFTGGVDGDLWEYDGATWTPLATDAGAPAPREGAAMGFVAFADGGSGLALVGGSSSWDGAGTNETWFGVWNRSTYAWTLAAGGGACDGGPDCFIQMVPDQPDPAGSLLMASGDGVGAIRLWRWNGTDGWDAQAQLASTALYAFQATPGSLGSNAYVVGGEQGTFDPFQEWVCDLKLECSPGHVGNGNPVPPLTVASLGFDDQGRGLLFGGNDPSGNTDFGAYLWNGFDWSAFVTPDGGGPGARLQPAMAFDPDDGHIWMVGGYGPPIGNPSGFGPLTDGWTFSVDAGWAFLGNEFNCPNSSPTLAYVPDGGGWSGMVLGNLALATAQDTARLVPLADGGVNPVELGPLVEYGAELVYDVVRGTLEAIGDGNGQLLEFGEGCDGGWCGLQTGPNLVLPYTAYDTASQRVLLIGEYQGDPIAGDLYAYAGGAIEPITIADPEGDGAPTDVSSAEAVAYDSMRGQLLAYGGELDAVHSSAATWDFQQATHRPGLACAFRFGAAEAPSGSSLQEVRIDAAGGADPAGAELDVWEAGNWVAMQACGASCPAASPGALSFDTTDPTQMQLLLSDLGTLGVGVASSAANGSGPAQVMAGPVQVSVRYRLP